MIIKKKRFNLTPGYRGKWPFTVGEVTVLILLGEDKKTALFGLVHRFGRFALNGALEPYGFSPLVQSGIWADDKSGSGVHYGITDDCLPVIKRSLTPFFRYIEAVAVHELGVKDDGKGGGRNGK